MRITHSTTENSSQQNIPCGSVAQWQQAVDNFSMAKKSGPYTKRVKPPPDFRLHGRIYLREWREFRHLTQEKLAELSGVGVSSITQIETGKMGWSPMTLRNLAKALKITPGLLLDVDPKEDEALWTLYGRANANQRQQILDLAKVIVKSN
jgi:transcriptional regulator with XRE-family HTH domain